MTDQLLQRVLEYIVAPADSGIGPVLVDASPELPGVWLKLPNHFAFLGPNIESAWLTAELSDWWIPQRDGELSVEDRNWFQRRATLGDDWKTHELPIYREERRIRLAHNIQLATDDGSSEPVN